MDSSKSQTYDKSPRVSPDFHKARETSGVVMPHSLFVGGISGSSTSEDLTEFFSKYGTVVRAKVVKDSRGLSKGYGFVTFEDEEVIKKIQEEGTYLMFQNRRVNVAPAIKKHYPPAYDKLSDQSSPPTSGSNIHYQSSSSAGSSTPYPSFHGGMAYVTPHQYVQTPLSYFTPHEATNFYQGTPIVHSGHINYGHYANMVGTPYQMTSPLLYPVASAHTPAQQHPLQYSLPVSSGSSNQANGHGAVNPNAQISHMPTTYAALQPQGVSHVPPPPVLHPAQMYAGSPVGHALQEPYPQYIHGYYPYVIGPHEAGVQYITVQDGYTNTILTEELNQNTQSPQEITGVVITDLTHTVNNGSTEQAENEIQENAVPVQYDGLTMQAERQMETICTPEYAVPIEYAEPIFPPNYSHPPPNIQIFSSLFMSAKTNCPNACEMDAVVNDSPRRSDYNRYKNKTPVVGDNQSNVPQLPFVVKRSYNSNPNPNNRYQKDYKTQGDVAEQDTQYKPKGTGYFNKIRFVHNENLTISYGQGEHGGAGYSTPSRNFARPNNMSPASTYPRIPQDNGYHQSNYMRAPDSRYMQYQSNATYANRKYTYDPSRKNTKYYNNQNGGYRSKFDTNRENGNGRSDGSDKTTPPVIQKKEEVANGTTTKPVTAGAGDSTSSSSCVTAQSSSSSTSDVCSQLGGLRIVGA